jgi:hypothetical protein
LSEKRWFFPALFGLLLAARMCHAGILWEGEAFPMAGAGQLLFGKIIYRGVWFDKPPLVALFYLPIGARPGWALRLEDALYALLCCWVVYRFGRDLWSRREGIWAAGLLGFYLVFYVPSAVTPVASDLLMLAPHAAAVWMAFRRRPFWSGALAAAAFWISPKGVFVAAACALWYPAGIPLMAAGWAAVSGAAVAWLWSNGALAFYWREVWQWGLLYAGTPLPEPVKNGLLRTLNWMGFHAAACVAAGWFLLGRRKRRPQLADAGLAGERLRWAGWMVVSAAGVAAGLRFFPRYYFLPLPVLALMAARGFTLLGPARVFVAALLVIPLARFGPTYVTAATGAVWRDTEMDRDSRAAAALIREASRPGDTLFVWGYRPEIYVYARLRAASRFLDSQPLTGVPADRYLIPYAPVEEDEDPRRNRAELTATRPGIIAITAVAADNPRLDIAHYADLGPWFAQYRQVARTHNTVIFRLQGR